MSRQVESSLIDYDDLRREIAEAIRSTLRELAAERGISYEDMYNELFGGTKRKPVSKRKAPARHKGRTRRVKRPLRRVSAG
jgi:hypothetical protein